MSCLPKVSLICATIDCHYLSSLFSEITCCCTWVVLLQGWYSESHPFLLLPLLVQQFSIIVFFNISFGSLPDRSASRDWKRPHSIPLAKGNGKEEKDLLFLTLIYCYFHTVLILALVLSVTRAPTLAGFLTIYHWTYCNVSYWLYLVLEWKPHILHWENASSVMFMCHIMFHNQISFFNLPQ